MDIYSSPGTKVVFAYPNSGHPCHQEDAEKHLLVGQTYTVKKTTVYDSRSTVEFEEVPGKTFNTVLFAPEDKFRRREGGERKGEQAVDRSKWTHRNRFNAIWNQLNFALSVLHGGNTKQAEELIIEAREWSNDGVSIAYREEQDLTTVSSLRARLAEVERVNAGMIQNIGTCGACAEGIMCGSTMHAHNEDCVYSERDRLRTRVSELEKYNRLRCSEVETLRAENAALREKHETLRMCTSNMLRNLNFEIFPAEALIAEANMLTKCDECQGAGYISTGSPDIKSVECPRCREQLGKGEG